MNNIAIKVDHVGKSFKLPHDKQNSLKGGLISIVKGGKRTYETQEVLKDISFEIKEGEFFGIVGRNGSGKSTLLKMLAGIYIPTSGSIQVNGPLTPFIELGVGFNPELTGRENVFLNGALLGFSRDEMTKMYDDIVSFAELERFMDQKLKNYSSGMQVRLAFSIAIRAQSSILLLDEVLAVGDAIFQKKCYDYFRKLKKDGHTVVLVSHDYSILEQYCDKGILIEKGKIIKEGKIQEVVTRYIDIISADSAKKETPESIGHVGSGEVYIDTVKLSHRSFGYDPETITITMNATAQKEIESPIFGISIVNESDYPIFSSNNLWLKQPIERLTEGQTIEATWDIPNIFNNGKHFINAAIATDNGRSIIDRIEKIESFTIKNKLPNGSYTNPRHHMTINTKG